MSLLPWNPPQQQQQQWNHDYDDNSNNSNNNSSHRFVDLQVVGKLWMGGEFDCVHTPGSGDQ